MSFGFVLPRRTPGAPPGLPDVRLGGPIQLCRLWFRGARTLPKIASQGSRRAGGAHAPGPRHRHRCAGTPATPALARLAHPHAPVPSPLARGPSSNLGHRPQRPIRQGSALAMGLATRRVYARLRGKDVSQRLTTSIRAATVERMPQHPGPPRSVHTSAGLGPSSSPCPCRCRHEASMPGHTDDRESAIPEAR